MFSFAVALRVQRARIAVPLCMLLFALLVSCTTEQVGTVTPPVTPPVVPVVQNTLPQWRPASFSELPGWSEADLSAAWQVWRSACVSTAHKSRWAAACALKAPLNSKALHTWLEHNVQLYQLLNADNSDNGLITGYYEPLLKGCRQSTPKCHYPVYAKPGDLLTIDLSSVYPELKSYRLRGRLVGNKVVPYFTRADIDGSKTFSADVLAYVEDPLELFFLQVQGSGRIALPDGSRIRIGYDDQNGYVYKSIGKALVDAGEMTLAQASMPEIRSWAQRNPERMQSFMNTNPSYVFFKEIPASDSGPVGAMGLPLTEGYSMAVDPRAIPLGTPVWLATTEPLSSTPLQRLMSAQDTGGAIKGAIRGDFFWGFGDQAGERAGRMKQRGQMWILWPKETPVPEGILLQNPAQSPAQNSGANFMQKTLPKSG